MKISVIIPTYKPQAYFWECLDSLKNQTFDKSEFEIVIVLNGCNEPYYNDIECYINQNLAECIVNFIQTDRCGVSNARNIAIDVSRGEYITFIDDDDFVSPTYLEELYNKADKDTVSLCYPLSYQDGTDKYEEYHITGDYNKNHLKDKVDFKRAKKFFSGPVYKLIHRDIIGDRRFDVHFKNGEDAIFMFLLSNKFKNVSFTTKNAIYYRRIRENGALSRKKSAKEILCYSIRMMMTFTSIYIKHPLQYNFKFFITRVLAVVHGAIEQFKI